MEIETKEKKPTVKLGLYHNKTSDLVLQLNHILADYHIHYQKLRNFHWNVSGKDFFDLHEKFEDEYNAVKVRIDLIAERIRVFGKYPLSNLSEYLGISVIEEAEGEYSDEEMVEEILNDFETIIHRSKEALEVASEIGDVATEDLLTGFIRDTEKTHWMYSSWLK